MAGLSMRSRYLRFHSPKPGLTDADRARLTDVDERNHLALVALAADGEPLGVARAVRRADDPLAAEVGAEVVDAHQREGLGTMLIARLARRAAAAGIERLVAQVLAESPLVSSLRRRGWRVVGRDGPSLTLEATCWRVAGELRPQRAGHG